MAETAVYNGPMGGKSLPFKAIPTIDIGPLFGEDQAARWTTARDIGLACETVGSFYILNHGAPEAVIDRAYDLSRRFHHSSIEQKQTVRVSRSRGARGWLPISDEAVDGDPELYRLTEPLPAAFDSANEIEEDAPGFPAGSGALAQNPWPDWIPGFKKGVRAYYEAVTAIGRALFEAFAIALDLPEDVFLKLVNKAPSQLRLLHYPSNDPPMDKADLGIGARPDFECFTILSHRSPGLQVMNAANEWVAAPPMPGAFIVNIGNPLEVWTNGRFKAARRRVVNTGLERYSIPLCFRVDRHTVVEPLPQFVSEDHPVKYSRILGQKSFARNRT